MISGVRVNRWSLLTHAIRERERERESGLDGERVRGEELLTKWDVLLLSARSKGINQRHGRVAPRWRNKLAIFDNRPTCATKRRIYTATCLETVKLARDTREKPGGKECRPSLTVRDRPRRTPTFNINRFRIELTAFLLRVPVERRFITTSGLFLRDSVREGPITSGQMSTRS